MLQDHPLLEFGPPPDEAAWAALALGCLATLLAARPLRSFGSYRAFLRKPPTVWVVGLALSAALLSAGYLHFYLRGGPRVIDATAYLLEARSFAEGAAHFEVPAPSAAFRGRFLVPAASDATNLSLGVLFPPGYPALLALGVLAGHPLWVGPFLAAALVVVTYGLAKRLSGRRSVGLLAASLSVLSAALRYHTADTMSHGWSAVLFAGGLWAALGPRRGSPAAHHALLSGACAGWLIATRPLTGLLCGAACAWLLLRPEIPTRRAARWALFGAALAPGLALLAWHQRELTGSWLNSVQLRYYALADGPPGCFGLGLGKHLGCQFEHGDVVARFGDEGFGPLWAIRNSLHRIHHHALDFANWEPAFLLVPWAAWLRRRKKEARVLLGLCLGIMAAYGGFYFHGNEPGVGARFFSELLPLEHALVAWAVIGTVWARWLPAMALLGFACHGSYSHRALSERFGGRPLFEAKVIEESLGPSHPGVLLFVDTDHGFLLGHDPSLPRQHVVPGSAFVARWGGDAGDWLLWARMGRPPAYRYRVALDGSAAPAIEAITWPALTPRSLRFEAEHQWPALDVRGGWVEPSFPPADCASRGRTLTIHRTAPDGALLRGTLDVPAAGSFRLLLGVVSGPDSAGPPPQGKWEVDGQERAFDLHAGMNPCARIDLGAFSLSQSTVQWTLTTTNNLFQLDFIEVIERDQPASSTDPPFPPTAERRPVQ